MLILNSSLLVDPVAFYPRKVLKMGVKLEIIHIQNIDLDYHAKVVIYNQIGDILP